MFKKAIRSLAKIKIAITGPSGAGKTYSALRLAHGMGGKIAVIDTENGSASLYSDRFEFDVLELQPPFTTIKYIEAIKAAEAAKYDILIIDSLSHAWAGEGGILERKGQKDSRGGNSYTNWAEFTKEQEKLTSTILQSKIHLIANMRSKQEYAVIQGDNNKTKIQKLGLAPIQRDGQEYEYTVVFDVAMNHEAETSKDRTGLFTDKIFQINEETGKTIRNWIDSSPKIEEPVKPIEIIAQRTTVEDVFFNDPSKISEDEASELWKLAKKKNLKDATVLDLFKRFGSVEKTMDLDQESYSRIFSMMENME